MPLEYPHVCRKTHYFKETVQDDTSYDVALELFGGFANFTQANHIVNTSYAAYGQGSYALTDRLNLTVGGRVTNDKKRVDRERFGYPDPVPLNPLVSKSANRTAFSPRVGLDYHWTSDLMTYVSVAQGTKSGGFNGRATLVSDFIEFSPETVWTYEVGVRSDLADRRLRLNATLFYSNYTDLQIQINGSSGNPPAPFIIVTNIPKSRIVGGEADVTAILSKGFKVIGGLGITDAKYRTLPTSPEFVSSAPISTDSHFPNTPEVSYSLAAEFSTTVSDKIDAIARIDYAHKSKMYFDIRNAVPQEPYGLVNARLMFDFKNLGLTLSAFGTNLTDEQYIVGGFHDGAAGAFGIVENMYAAPREWGISAEYRF